MMTLDGLGAGLDEQRVRARLSSVPSRPGLAGRVVADREAEEVEPRAPVDGVPGVTDPRLARLELQPDPAQPFLGNLPCARSTPRGSDADTKSSA